MGLIGWNSATGDSPARIPDPEAPPDDTPVKEEEPLLEKMPKAAVEDVLRGQSTKARMNLFDYVFIVVCATAFGVKINPAHQLIGGLCGFFISCVYVAVWLSVCEDLL